MKTSKAWITSLAIALPALGTAIGYLSHGQPTLAGPGLSPVPIPATLLSPIPTPPGPEMSTLLSPLTPPTGTELITQAWLPLVADHFPFALTYGKKGVGDSSFNWMNDGPGSHMAALTYNWYYDWRYNLVPARNNDPQYVRMVNCLEYDWPDMYGVTQTITETAHADFINNRRGRVWLILNEPDGVYPQCGGYSLNPPALIRDDPVNTAIHFSHIHDMIKSSDPYAKVYAGGLVWLNATATRMWWQTFVNTLQAEGLLYKLEGVHLHLYPKISTSSARDSIDNNCAYPNCIGDLAQVANDWYGQMHVGLGLGDRPLWISEVGWSLCDGVSREWVRDNAMNPLSQWFAGYTTWPYYPQIPLNPGYDAAAWFVTYDYDWKNHREVYACTALLSSFGLTGTATTLGVQWNAYHP